MMYSTIDSSGFLSGSIAEPAVNRINARKVVYDAPPETALPPLHTWRRVDGAWVATLDLRGQTYYDPNNTDSEFRPATFDAAPTPGYILLAPGQPKTISATEILAKAKTAQWRAIKSARAAAEFGGFTWGGSTFDSDTVSQGRIQGGVQLAGLVPGFTIDWTLADNTVRNLNAADMVAVGVALAQHVGAQHAKARALREQIEAAQTVAEVGSAAW